VSPATPPDEPPRRFGAFELDAAAGELRKHGHRVRLQPQPFNLLKLLMGRPGRLVSRDEIRKELWPEGTFVDFDQAVNFAIRQIRDALGDSADNPIYVETVPKRGYRFIAPVQVPRVAPSDGPTTARMQKALWANVAELRLAERRHRRMVWLLAIVGGAIAVLAIVLLLRR
jgi:DNA-binding winged helix-turn-helix (wHTH) protein